LEGRFPVLRRDRMSENNSGSLSMKGTLEFEFELEIEGEDEGWAMEERKELGPARVRVSLVVWKI